MSGAAVPCERELAYYRRLVDELAAARLDTEHVQWALQAQLRQKNQGFLLLARLTRTLAAQTDTDAIFRTTVLEVNRVLGMDRTIALVPEGAAYRPAHFAGVDPVLAATLAGERFVRSELVAGEDLRLVRRASAATPEVSRLREVFGLVTFVCVPVAGPGGPMGVIVSGRSREDATFCPPLDDGDADTFRAIASALTAVVESTRLALREESQRLREQFFTELSHELRTPLHLVVGPLAQVLAGRWGELPEAAVARLRVVERNQARLLDLVNEILELARLTAGAAELRLERLTDVNGLLRACAAHFRAAAEVRGLELRLDLDEALDRTCVRADRVKLDRLVFNLLSNAFKFTDSGHVEVRSRRAGDELEIAVADTGIGLSPMEQARVFTRFVSGGGQGRGPGSGIGLALVEEIARRHGGRVAVTSEQDRGSCFLVRLPLGGADGPRAEAAEIASHAHPGRPAVAEDAADRRGERDFDPARPIVLCVEDDVDLRGHLRDVLAGEFNVFLAVDGVDGLEQARRYLPDVIVADQMMPRMDGRALLEALRGDRDLETIPVAFLTARHDRQSRLGSLAAGADDYIGKPFDDDELCARVRNLVRGRAQARQLAQANRRLELRVREQVAALVRAGELERYLAPAVVASLRGGRRAAAPPDHQWVSVLVVELDGLAVAGGLEPAVLAGLVDEYLGAVSAIASARGGTIDGLAGGRLSVLFGAPEPGPPAASAGAALETAVEVRTRLVELAAAARRRGLAHGFGGRLAIASGTALVGGLGGEGQRAYTAVGAPVAEVARLLAAARAQVLVCDAATRELLADRLGPRALRPCDDGGFEILETGPVASVATPPVAAPSAAKVLRSSASRAFRREGDYWTIVYGGELFRLHDMKGLEVLARLLAQPHVELHALDLAAAPGGEQGRGERRGADAGPGLDAAAKRAYKSRLRELDEELAEAQSFADPVRTERLEAEVHLLAHQLSTAVGLGGRDRPVASVSERARINVSRGVKAAIDKIALSSTTLARHLRASVRTGMFSSYAPHPGVPDSWDVQLDG